ncbi:putative ring-2 protein [Botrytis fragariae]|uniref:Methylated-DNA--protein-cysteine methyltransferase n=1 Tax=Botrytis fragariae TaxID=1964551 RepID=A0A8H6APC8_9HELO|nr:putative ring-2 protein [Botrytis fragariae]KAF5871179.1 putative ring-2 protein [Botrytis fragariae]
MSQTSFKSDSGNLTMTGITDFQRKVYTLLLQIPAGKVSSYASLAKALSTAPRAVGGALRRNPYAPQVPCHRIICADGAIGGFKGEAQNAPSGINQNEKLGLLKSEGVEFDENGQLKDEDRWWDEFRV